MASGRSTNTMVEGLQNTLRDISMMKTAPDANLEFLAELELQILSFLRQPMEQAMTAGAGAGGAPGAGGTPMGPAPAPPGAGAPTGGGPSFAGQGVPGLRTQPMPPSADELQRLLG